MRGGDLSLAINMIRMKIDTILNRSNLSSSCADFLELFLDEIEQGTTWTLRLLDAQGKPPSGMMRGKSKLYGSYDECLQLNIDTKRYQNDFPALPNLTTGRYCHAYIPLSKMLDSIPNSAIDQIGLNIKPEQVEKIRSYSSATSADYVNPDVHVCIPSTCSNEDINRLIKSASKTLKVHKILKFVLGNCDDGTSKPLDSIESAIIIFFGLLILISLIGTIMDWYLARYNMKSKSTLINLSLNFSIIRNGTKLLNTKLSSDSISCLHGIKVLAMIFIVIGHGSLTLLASLAVDFTELQERSQEFPIQYAIQTTPWVDTFFVISGLLVSYHVMTMARKISKQLKGKSDLMKVYISCRGLLGVYFYRYIRLIIPLICTLLLSLIWGRISSGPNWYVWNEEIASSCKKDWPKLVFMMNNLYPLKAIEHTCLGPTWYISNDFQFFMLAPFLLMLSILGMPLICWTLNGTIILASVLLTGFIVYTGDHIPTLMLLPEFINGYYEEVYIKPWCRIGPYCFGLVLGEILSIVGRNFKINKILNTSLWLMSIFTVLFIIYYPYKFAKYGYDVYESIAYALLHRLAWSIVWSWMIFSMVTGNFPLADKFFSWPPFIFLSRLTYGVFLLQWLVYSHFAISNRTYLSATTSFGAVMISGIYLLTNVGAFLLTLLVEYPTQSLLHIYQNYLLGSGRDKRFEIRPSSLTSDQKNNPVKLTAVIKAHV